MKILPIALYCTFIINSLTNVGNLAGFEPKTNVNTASVQKDNTISFKVNGALVKTDGWNISRFDMGSGVQLNITTNMHTDKRTIMFNINGAAKGVYLLSSQGGSKRSGYGNYKPDYQDMLNAFSFQSGSLVITDIDLNKNRLNATFSGTVKSNKGQVLQITEGKIINGKIMPNIVKY